MPVLPRVRPLLVCLLAGLAPLFTGSLARAAVPDPPPRAPAPGGPLAYFTDGRKVSVFDPAAAMEPVARIGADSIHLSELTEALATIHAQSAPEAKAGHIDSRIVLDRLVELHLVAQEARAMGMADLPELRAAIANIEEGALRGALRAKVGATAKPDPKVVERQYRDAVREWSVVSVAFQTEADAKAFVARVRAGEKFEALAKQALADKKAQGETEPRYLAEQKMAKPILDAVKKLAPRAVSAPVAVDKRFVVLRQDGVRYPENAEVRARVVEAARQPVREKMVRDYYAQLVKRYARIDRARLASIDFNAKKPGMAALVKDQRPVAQIEGEKPVTVADVAEAAARQLFHASDRPESKKIMAERKKKTFEDLLSKRLFTKEARAQRLGETAAFRAELSREENQLLVGSYVQKVLVPGVKVGDDEVRRYYDANKKEFTSPAMYKLEALVFGTQEGARTALQRARAGTDFKWLRQNLPGQVSPEVASLDFSASPVVSAADAPPELAKALAGSKAGDFREYSQSEKEHYLVHVLEVYPPQVQPLEAVQGPIKGKLSGIALDRSFKETAAKLRQSQKVEVLLARIEM